MNDNVKRKRQESDDDEVAEYAERFGFDSEERQQLKERWAQRKRASTGSTGVSLMDVALEINREEKKTLKEEKKTLKEEKKTLKGENKTLKGENKTLREENKTLKEETIGRLIDLHGSSILDKELVDLRNKFHLVKGVGATDSSHLYPHHTPAEIDTEDSDFVVDPLSFLQHGTNDFRLKSSFILSEEQWPLTYLKERCVQGYVSLVLCDAVKYINWVIRSLWKKEWGTKPLLRSRAEASIFSNRPDFMVVYDETNSYTILPVEVKKPHKDVFTSSKVCGQMYDYVKTGHLMFGRYTFGVLTTFNESKVLWKSGTSCDDQVEKEERLSKANLENLVNKILCSENVSAVSSRQSTEIPAQSPASIDLDAPETKQSPDSPGPENTTSKSSQSPPDLRECQYQGNSHSQAQMRSLKQTQVAFKAHELFTLLCNAIVASMILGKGKLKVFKDYESNGTVTQGDEVLCLMVPATRFDVGYRWEKIEKTFKVKGQWSVDENQKKFWLVELLGVGATCRVWRAVVPSQDEEQDTVQTCAVKFWVKVCDDNTKTLTRQEIVEESRKSSTREVEHYKAIYDDLFFKTNKTKVGCFVLNHRYSVILPYFVPIGKDERQASLASVRKVLRERFYKNGKSYQFQECDQRWRHVGKYNGEIVLFDLADLVIEDMRRDEHKEYVERHVAKLLEDI